MTERSLPHRQLRNGPRGMPRTAHSSLPHRQLRNFSSDTYQRNSPGLAGLGWFGSSHAAQKRLTHSPSAVVGGLPAATTRWRMSGLSVRSQPISVRNWLSVKWVISSKPLKSWGRPFSELPMRQ